VYIKVDTRASKMTYIRYGSSAHSFTTQQDSIWHTGTGFLYLRSLKPKDYLSNHTLSDHGTRNKDSASAVNYHSKFFLRDNINMHTLQSVCKRPIETSNCMRHLRESEDAM
jgi:hypothetical protein